MKPTCRLNEHNNDLGLNLEGFQNVIMNLFSWICNLTLNCRLMFGSTYNKQIYKTFRQFQNLLWKKRRFQQCRDSSLGHPIASRLHFQNLKYISNVVDIKTQPRYLAWLTDNFFMLSWEVFCLFEKNCCSIPIVKEVKTVVVTFTRRNRQTDRQTL